MLRLSIHTSALFLAALCLGITSNISFQKDDPYKSKRERMVRLQIEARGVFEKSVLNAMRIVPRHKFVPKNRIDDAYDDGPVPIGYGQTISQPFIVGYMTEVIQPKKNHKVLEIGTGSGYQAAILAEIVDSVFTIEIISELHNSSNETLQKLGYKNILTKNADGYFGWEKYSPFDAIVVTAASEFVPPPLIKQLKDGGKMIIPVGSPFLVQSLVLVEKKGEKIFTKNLMHVRFVPFLRGK